MKIEVYRNEQGSAIFSRYTFADGSTAVYDLRRDQPHPITVKCVETIRKWNGYNNQPMRRRRKP